MPKSKIGTWTYFFSALALLTAGFAYTHFTTPSKPLQEDATAIGRAEPQGPDVRLRSVRELGWRNLRNTTHVHGNDRLFTGSDSSAKVYLKKGQIFTIEPNSMATIADNTGDPLLNLDTGRVIVDLPKGTSLLVKSKDQISTLQSQGSKIRLESSDNVDEVKMTVLQGETTVQESPRTPPKIINVNHEILLSRPEHKPEPLRISLLKPAENELIWTDESEINLLWRTPHFYLDHSVELSMDPTFANGTITQTAVGDKLTVTLPSTGTWYWRVHEPSSGAKSVISIFSYHALTAPIITDHASLSPLFGLNGKTKDPVPFQWADQTPSTSYEVQISRDGNFKSPEHTSTTTTTETSIPQLAPGDYLWRVISRHPSRQDLISKVGRVEILAGNTPSQIRHPSSPDLSPPLAAARFTKSSFDFELIESGPTENVPGSKLIRTAQPSVDWEPAPAVETQTLHISPFEDFRTFQEIPVRKNSWTWTTPPVSLSFIRIKSTLGKKSSLSETAKLRTVFIAPSFILAEALQENRGAPIVHFLIKSHPQSRFHEIQVADEPSFKQPISFITRGTSVARRLEGSNIKFIRVRSSSEQAWPLSRFSAIHRIVIPPRLDYKQSLALEDPDSPLRQYRPVREVASATPGTMQTVAEPGPGSSLSASAEDLKILRKEYRVPSVSAWGGFGSNYLRFQQEGSSDLNSGTFGAIAMPAYMVGANMRITDLLHLQFDYHSWPGKVRTTANTRIDRTDYNWTSTGLEAQYRFLEKRRLYYTLLTGVQSHRVPILFVNNDGTSGLAENQLQNLSVGAKANYIASSNYEYEFFMRYQTLLSSNSLGSADFRATPSLLFDGSLGIAKRLEGGLRWGLYWFGQYQDFKYELSRSGTVTNGSQNLFNSNIQLRMGYDFGL